MTDSGESPSRSLEDLGLDERLVSMLRDEWGINDLYPPQAEALPHSLSGRSVMLAAPTASGKSLVAHLTIVQRLITDLKGGLALYLVPLKALANEKLEELRGIAAKVGLRVGLAIGDRGGETSMIEDMGNVWRASATRFTLVAKKTFFHFCFATGHCTDGQPYHKGIANDGG